MKNVNDERLQRIVKDKFSGSKEILFNINNFFLSEGISNYHDLENSLFFLKNETRDFSAIQNYLQKLIDFLSAGKFKEADLYIQSFEEKENTKLQNIYSNLKPSITGVKSIVTISNSFTLLHIFRLMKKDFQELTISISEGRPNLEGRIFAEKLAETDIKINLITEAMIPAFVQKSDAAIIGADSILSNGNVINKTGSLIVALACKHYQKPFYVLAEKSKRKNDNLFKEAEKDSDEIYKSENSNIKIKNLYFEEIDNELITKIIMD